jgi:hypothetical protein
MMRRRDVIELYPEPVERPAPEDNALDESLYDQAERMRKDRKSGNLPSDPKSRLARFKKELLVSSKIKKRQLLIEGEILWDAKKACTEDGINFLDWIEENFSEFSYSTANNRMCVYIQLNGKIEEADWVSETVLTKISKPKFPSILRDWVVDTADPKKIRNKHMDGIVDDFERGGIDAVEHRYNWIVKKDRVHQQTWHSFNLLKKAIGVLKDYSIQIDKQGRSGPVCPIEKNKDQEKEALEINTAIKRAFKESIKPLTTVQKEVTARLGELEADAPLKAENL